MSSYQTNPINLTLNIFRKLMIFHLSVLNDLFNASISSTVDTTSANTILTDHHHGTIVSPLSPSLHHVHQLHQGVGGGGHLVALWPAHELKQLTCLTGGLHTRHQLCQGHNLLVNLEYPGSTTNCKYSLDFNSPIAYSNFKNRYLLNKYLMGCLNRKYNF